MWAHDALLKNNISALKTLLAATLCTITLAVAACLPTAKAQAQTDASQTYSVALTGDIMMGTTFPNIQLPTNDGRQLFVDAVPILRSADVAAGNFEGTFANDGTTDKKPSKVSYAFRTPTTFAPRLKEAGYDFLSLANNHSMDFGTPGLRSTMAALQQQGIAYAGVAGYPSSVIVERKGVRFGFCAFGHNGYTLRHRDLNTVRDIITRLCNSCDIVIVSFHGGAEGVKAQHLPQGSETFLDEDRGNLREFAHFCIDAGADIVYGHGPHVPRAVELYKNHFIAYSLGNFCTPYGISIAGVSGYAPLLLLNVTRDGRFVSGRIHSFVQQRGAGPVKDPAGKAAHTIRALTTADISDPGLHIDDDGSIRCTH